ncbi:MAG: SDR family oxidoreductase [Solirubrobacterales bacterium]|nr:SDR family oxidoreductase [Solirubrobacterales bacterium]
MSLAGKVVLITGAAGGIGRALAVRCAAEGACLAVTDVREEPLGRLASELGEHHLVAPCDVSDPDAFTSMLSNAQEALGTIDVCIANAGIAEGSGVLDTSDDVWDRAFAVNVRAHVTAARALVPAWLQRGDGRFVSIASAAGLLTQIDSAPYAVSKHAAVAFAEWLAVTYGSRGVRVSCVCPMGVATAMLDPGSDGALGEIGSRVVRGAGEVLEADDVATLIIEALDDDRFLILPHPEVLTYFRRKATDYERWLAGMRRLQDSVGRTGATRPRDA